MTQVDPEEFFPLVESARYFPRPGGKKILLQTLYRWTSKGVRGCRLRTIRLGQQTCTSERWVREFIANLNSDKTVELSDMASADHAERLERVEGLLNSAGF